MWMYANYLGLQIWFFGPTWVTGVCAFNKLSGDADAFVLQDTLREARGPDSVKRKEDLFLWELIKENDMIGVEIKPEKRTDKGVYAKWPLAPL